MMTHWLGYLDRFLPRRLTTRIMLGLVSIVILAGFVTTLAINQILARNLRQELDNSGRAIAVSLGESLSNSLLEVNLASIQEMLNNTLATNPDVVYLFAYGPHTPIVHTFPDGFPRDLLRILNIARPSFSNPVLLQTENGVVHDFVVRPLDGIPAELHLGISENRIQAEQRKVTTFVLGLTIIGCLLASGMTYAFGQLATHPLVELTRGVRRLGQGKLDERIALPAGGEIGELAQAFNAMADEIQSDIHRLQASEAGYRTLLSAAGEVGEGIALISDETPGEGTLLFVNETFAHLTGFEIRDLMGMNLSSVLHPDSIDLARKSWQTIRQGETQSASTELILTDRIGNKYEVETASTLIEYQGRRALVWFTRDITNRNAKEQELRLRNRELAAINAVALALSEPFSPDVLQRGLREALSALELDTGWVTLIQTDGKSEVVSALGVDLHILDTQFPACVCGEVFHTGLPAIVDVNERCALHGLLQAQDSGRLRHATVPLAARGKTFGVLNVAFPYAHPFDEYNLRLLSAIGKQMGIALENANLWAELRQKEQLRSELLARSLHAQEGERQRIARELHDATGQSLNAILFGLKAAETALDSDIQKVRLVLTRLKAAASDTVRELQTIIYDLRPSVLDDLGLIPALRWYAEQRLENEGVRVVWHVAGQEQRLQPEIETALFRIGQEAITNISKYANAGEVQISLTFETDRLLLQITDAGKGFDVESTLTQRLTDGRGLGLLGMRERAELLGGELEIRSEPGQGTHILVSLPLSVGNRETAHG